MKIPAIKEKASYEAFAEYRRMGGVSIISGTSSEVRREPFPTSAILMERVYSLTVIIIP